MSGQENIDASALEERDNSYLLVFLFYSDPQGLTEAHPH